MIPFRFRAVAVLALTLVSVPASAQTLTVELEGEGALVVDTPTQFPPRSAVVVQGNVSVPHAPPRQAPEPVARAAAGPAPRPGAVIVVRPPEAPRPVRVAAAQLAPLPVRAVAIAPVPQPVALEPETEDSAIEGSAHVGFFVDGMNLAPLGFTFSSPEIQALRGVHLDAQWGGLGALEGAATGGLRFGFGMRAGRYFRGPRVQFSVGGGDVDGEWTAAPGAEGLELSVQSVALVRVGVSAGIQLPLGGVTPYALARASIGGAFAELAVRDERLGRIGNETADALLPELGIEAGLDIEVEPGVDLGLGYRGNFLGAESHGLFLQWSFHGE